MPFGGRPPQHVRKVDDHGRIRFRGRKIHCSKAFTARNVALRATPTEGLFDLCYRSHVLLQVDLQQNITQPVDNVPEHLSTMCPV